MYMYDICTSQNIYKYIYKYIYTHTCMLYKYEYVYQYMYQYVYQMNMSIMARLANQIPEEYKCIT